MLDKTVRQCRLSVVDMSDDRKVTNMLHDRELSAAACAQVSPMQRRSIPSPAPEIRMLFGVLMTFGQDAPDRIVVERILADHLSQMFDHRDPNVIFLAPFRPVVNVPNLDLGRTTDHGEQFLEHLLTQMASFARVVLDRRHSVTDVSFATTIGVKSRRH